MRAEGPFDRRNARREAARIAAAADAWGIAVPAVGLWAASAAQRVPRGPARWTLDWDPRLRLVSFEVWAEGTRVFGIDDLVA